MSLKTLPILPRTARPAVAGMPVWYAEASQPRTQLDIAVTVPTGPSRKLILLWGSDGGEFPTAVTFDPSGVAFAMIPIDGGFGEEGSFRVAGYYLDAPPEGAKVVRIETANPVWSAASLKVDQNARAGLPQAGVSSSTSGITSVDLDEAYLLDAFSISHDLVLGAGLSDGDFTPLDDEQILGADDIVNASFLATTSDRRHDNNGSVAIGWQATSAANQLQAVVSVLFSTGQIAATSATPLVEWNLEESSGTFLDTYGRTNAAKQSGLVSGGHDPLFSGGGSSISMQDAQIVAAHHVDAQIPNWSAEIYLQPRAWPVSGNDAILSKDSGLPVPGGFQVEVEADGAIDFYIRDATGLAGTATHVTDTAGNGTLTLDVAHVIHLTYNDDTKTAAIYLDRALLASKTDPNFTGLQNNASAFSLFSRSGTAGVELDGVGDRVTFFAGVLTADEIAARPAPTTITDPFAPGAITAVSDNAGTVVQGNNDIDVLANDTGKTGPHYDIEITDDPNGRLSVVNDQSATAKLRITMPAPATGDRVESGSYRVREGTSPSFGNPSNDATVSWRQAGTGGGATFPFVTDDDPPVTHAGVAARPGYSPSDPRSASITDPMSGIEMFRVGGNNGSNVLINGSTDSGFDFPRKLMTENLGIIQKTWNADSTLLMVDRYFSRSGDPSNPVKSYIIDVTGSYTGGPWRIIRAAGSPALGDGLPSGMYWVWDQVNPLRAFAFASNGSVYEWWPVGGGGHSVGELTLLYGAVSGFDNWTTATRARLHTSQDGRYINTGCRRTSDGRWGGRRRDLQTGDLDPFIPYPGNLPYNGDSDRALYGCSPLGNYARFNTGQDDAQHFYNMVTGAFASTCPDLAGHAVWALVDGKEYFCGTTTGGVKMWDIAAGLYTPAKATFSVGSNHFSGLNYLDKFETHGATGGSTSGLRYVIYSRYASPRKLLGIRLGVNDVDQVRFIGNHRSVRTDNSNEVHPSVSPNGRYVAFNSNWQEPGVESNDDVHPYIAVLPDAWYSPNNDGS